MITPTTFEHDLIGYKYFANSLESFLTIEQPFMEGSLVVALSAEFGAGKTTFLRMWQHKLSAMPEGKSPLVVALNAWESDYIGDPLFAIVSAIVKALGAESEISKKIIQGARQVGLGFCNVVNQGLTHMTNVDIAKAKAVVDKAGKIPLQNQLEADAFSLYQARKSAMQELKSAIKEFVAGQEPYVLFLVDELDRCRPDYAISYLETIKHIFDIPKAVFILAADRQQLENSAKHAFGPDLNFNEYYRKFIHRETILPAIEERGYYKISREYIDHFVEKADIRSSLMLPNACVSEQMMILAEHLKLTPRQMQEAYRIVGHISSKEDLKQQGKFSDIYAIVTITMALLKVGDQVKYQALGLQNLEPKQLLEWVRTLSEPYTDWWFSVLFLYGGTKREKGKTSAQIAFDLKVFGNMDISHVEDRLSNFKGIGMMPYDLDNIIPSTYQRIEQLMQWQVK